MNTNTGKRLVWPNGHAPAIALDDDLQAALDVHLWLHHLPKWCKWEHGAYDTMLMLCETVQRQRELLAGRLILDSEGNIVPARKWQVGDKWYMQMTYAGPLPPPDFEYECYEDVEEN